MSYLMTGADALAQMNHDAQQRQQQAALRDQERANRPWIDVFFKEGETKYFRPLLPQFVAYKAHNFQINGRPKKFVCIGLQNGCQICQRYPENTPSSTGGMLVRYLDAPDYNGQPQHDKMRMWAGLNATVTARWTALSVQYGDLRNFVWNIMRVPVQGEKAAAAYTEMPTQSPPDEVDIRLMNQIAQIPMERIFAPPSPEELQNLFNTFATGGTPGQQGGYGQSNGFDRRQQTALGVAGNYQMPANQMPPQMAGPPAFAPPAYNPAMPQAANSPPPGQPTPYMVTAVAAPQQQVPPPVQQQAPQQAPAQQQYAPAPAQQQAAPAAFEAPQQQGFALPQPVAQPPGLVAAVQQQMQQQAPPVQQQMQPAAYTQQPAAQPQQQMAFAMPQPVENPQQPQAVMNPASFAAPQQVPQQNTDTQSAQNAPIYPTSTTAPHSEAQAPVAEMRSAHDFV